VRAGGRPTRVAVAEPSDEEWRDRFGLHNLVMGLLLAAWGVLQSAGPPVSGGDKVLASHTQLKAVLDVVQVVSLVNGFALFLSGVALRRGWRWGYPLAILCGMLMVLVGGVFFAGYRDLSGGPYIEHGVALLTFVRQNLDMLIGAVDGLGLLWFVSRRVGFARALFPDAPPSRP
jgi:hypothetical protein